MATEVQPASTGANGRPLKEDSSTAVNGTSTSATMRCPDPSAHTRDTKDTALQDHASAAALYSTNPPKGNNVRQEPLNVLGPDGRLSSASAATSLKYARAHDLPSYPIVGIDTASSAGTAALLANANQKSPEWPRPEASSAAGKAALLAHDYKMKPLWQPEASAAGSKAALLAHRDGPKLNLWQPEASATGNSAANIAMKRQGLSPVIDFGHTDDGRKKALVAATGAVSSSTRKRAQSTPVAPPLYPDSANSARNALSAATIAHTPSMRARKAPVVEDSNRLGSGAMEAARIQHSKSISRDMYTEHPPIRMEVEEKQRQDALRASAISMAKQMMVAQKNIDEAGHAQSGAKKAHGQSQGITGEEDLREKAKSYIHVQEAAQKLAAERLAKIGFDENAAYRSYYGYEKPSRSKLSIRGRQRASSNPETADSDDEDDFRSRRIRSQMSQLNKTLKEVDAKRDQDRKYLIAAAERKVQAQMQGLDKKIYDETGKMSPAMLDEWDARARAKAVAASEVRMQNHGKVHIGHGKFMDQADIDAVALARIQPTLDEINEKTEKRRAEDAERRLELEEQKRLTQREKQRAAELKAEEKHVKDEEKRASKAQTAEEKAAKRQEKEAEKEKRAEEKRLQQQEKRKSREPATVSTAVAVVPVEETTAVAAAPDDTVEETPTAQDEHDDLYRDPTPNVPRDVPHVSEPTAAEPTSPSSPTSPVSPTSPTSAASGDGKSKGLKGFLSKFKRRSKHSASTAETDKPGFIGGAALRSQSPTPHRGSVPSSPGHTATQASSGPQHESARRFSDVSSLSEAEATRGRSAERIETKGTDGSGGTEFEEARDEFDEKLAPPPTFTSNEASPGGKGSPNRDSKFHEVGI